MRLRGTCTRDRWLCSEAERGTPSKRGALLLKLPMCLWGSGLYVLGPTEVVHPRVLAEGQRYSGFRPNLTRYCQKERRREAKSLKGRGVGCSGLHPHLPARIFVIEGKKCPEAFLRTKLQQRVRNTWVMHIVTSKHFDGCWVSLLKWHKLNSAVYFPLLNRLIEVVKNNPLVAQMLTYWAISGNLQLKETSSNCCKFMKELLAPLI